MFAAMFRWVSITPLDFPVVPDEKGMVSTAVLASNGSFESDSAIASESACVYAELPRISLMNAVFFGRNSKILLFEGVIAPLESRTTTGKSSGKPY